MSMEFGNSDGIFLEPARIGSASLVNNVYSLRTRLANRLLSTLTTRYTTLKIVEPPPRMHNYYDPPIPHHANGLAISLGDEELFGLLDDLEPELAPQSPERRMAAPVVGGQPRISKKSSKSTLRSRKSTATLKSPPAPLTSMSMAQSAGAAAGPHAYAASATFTHNTRPGPNIAPAAAAAAHSQLLRTPIKQEPMDSPSTIIARSTPRTIQYTSANQPQSHAPSPTPATRLRSSGKLVAPASEYSPAKGVFEKPKPKAKRRSPPVPDMSSAMSQFQVTLNGQVEAQPISVPKPPEKNMQPSSVVGVGAVGTSMAARAARASAQQTRQHPDYYSQPNTSMSANAGASSMNMSMQARQNAQMMSQMSAQANAQMSTNASAASMRQRRMNAYWPQMPVHGLPQQQQQQQHMQQSRHNGPPPQPQMQQMGQSQQQMASPNSRQQQPNLGPQRQQHPQQRQQPQRSQTVQQPQQQQRQQHQQYYSQPPLPVPQYRAGPTVSPFSSDVSSYSPPTDIETKSITPPVFSPPVSRSSSIRSPMSEDQWLVDHGTSSNPLPRARQMETPPTPVFGDKIPEFDDFKIDWNDGMDDQWDVLGFLK